MTTTAAHYTPGRQGHTTQIIAIHSAENQELPGQAKHLGQWFAGPTAPQASANEMVDNTTIVGSVDDKDTAWALDNFPLNLVSFSIELTGHASNSAAQWADAYEKGVLKEATIAVKAEMALHGIPAVHLTDSQIVAVVKGDKTIKGIITHADATRALKIVGGHIDPGQSFPLQEFIKGLQ